MSDHFLDIAMTDDVCSVQKAMGSDRLYRRVDTGHGRDRFNDNETRFIADRDSFYMATVSETGWPYLQHRGGPRGFLRVLDERTLAFADFRGNRQYISVGNALSNSRCCLFLIDYPRRARLKIYAHIEILPLDADPKLTEYISGTNYRATPERLLRLHLEAFDWNCAQHITPRYTAQQINAAHHTLTQRLQLLEAELQALRRG